MYMNRTKNFISLLMLLFSCQFIFSGKTACAAESNNSSLHSERLAFANNFANTVLAIVSDQKKSYENRKEVLEQAFSKSVDIDWIAKFVIGRAWNKASDEQKERYTELYRRFLTKTYVDNFAQNPDKRISAIKIINVNDASEDASNDNFNVATQMKLTNQDTLNVNYLVREKSGRYKVLDIAIENVSLITTHRAEFTALAATDGVDGVIRKLNQLLNKGTEITMSMK